jgi:ribonucleoside-diphosphate reductase alpha chain
MKLFKSNEVYAETLKYFNNDEMATNVWMKKYALKNNDGEFLEMTPADTHHRMAREFARIEKDKFKNPLTEKEIYEYLENFKYIVVQGSPMSAIGNTYQLESTGNCYVIKPPFDSYGGITYTDQQLVQLMKRRCGVGLDISTIRPQGTTVLNAAKTTDGIEIFMERFSNTCREVAQNGRSGAEIQLLSVNHPDILTFIKIKRDKTKVTGANLSVKITDEFMQAVKEDKDFNLRWPIDAKNPSIEKKIKAKDIWNELITSVWEGGEPGVLFWDNAIKYSLSNKYGVKDENFYDIACNPCGEIIMGLDSCRLMVLNLWSYVENPFTKNSKFNYDLFSKHVVIAQRLMDDLIDIEIEQISKILKKIEKDPEPDQIKIIEKDMWKMYLNNCKNGRRTGLGITALGDTLAGLGLTYASKKSIEVVNEIYKTLAINSMKSSCLIAKEIGTFPLYDKEIDKDNIFLNRLLNESIEVKQLHEKYGRRNISLTTNSPTGTISMLTQTSSGIEPVFRVDYTRRRKLMSNETIKPSFIDATGDKWTDYKVYHHKFELFKKITGKEKMEDSPYFQSTANDIDWEASVELQAIAQKWISHSISKTVNIPKNATKELVEKIYLKAWELGCKGITIYRDKSRDGVLIETEEKVGEKIIKTHAPKRPKELPCDIYHVKITKKLDKVRVFDYLVAVGVLNGDPYEVFAVENGKYDKKLTNGKIIKESRGRYHLIFSDNSEIKDITADTTETEDALTRMTSTSLRHGAEVQFIVEQLNKVTGAELFGFAKAIARALKHYIKNNAVSGEICGSELPDGTICNQKMIFENGCKICKVCGASRCS